MRELTVAYKARGFAGFSALDNNVRIGKMGLLSYAFALPKEKARLGGWRTGTLTLYAQTDEELQILKEHLKVSGSATGRWYITERTDARSKDKVSAVAALTSLP